MRAPTEGSGADSQPAGRDGDGPRRARPRGEPLRPFRHPRVPAGRACSSARTSRSCSRIIQPSEVTEFVAELGIIFLLFFLGLEFTLDRLQTQRHAPRDRRDDRLRRQRRPRPRRRRGRVRASRSPAFILAGAVYVSSSAVAVKGLIDFRRLADDETDLVLAILIVEDIAIAFVLAFAGGGGGELDGLARARREGDRLHRRLARGLALARPADRPRSSSGCRASSSSSSPSRS